MVKKDFQMVAGPPSAVPGDYARPSIPYPTPPFASLKICLGLCIASSQSCWLLDSQITLEHNSFSVTPDHRIAVGLKRKMNSKSQESRQSLLFMPAYVLLLVLCPLQRSLFRSSRTSHSESITCLLMISWNVVSRFHGKPGVKISTTISRYPPKEAA